MQQPWPQAARLGALLEENRIAYQFVGDTALALQGVAVEVQRPAAVDVQWDNLGQARALLPGSGPLETYPGGTCFRASYAGLDLLVRGPQGAVIAADPERALVERDGQQLYARSLAFYRRHLPVDDPRQAAITAAFAAAQQAHAQMAAAAWGDVSAYAAWVERYGPPTEAAARIARDPVARLGPLWPYLGDVAGQRVANLLGSYGGKAVALALLGADVTVVDISPENAAYARDLAAAAGVEIRYVVADVLGLPPAERTGAYDVVLMEIGILHYFLDLRPLVRVVTDLLRPGGRLLLQDFHPVSTKLITSTGKKHKVTGNYFDPGLTVSQVAYSKYLTGEVGRPPASPPVRHRKWTLGEVVTAVAEGGLRLLRLDEEPNTKLDDIGIPKTFTLLAEKS